MTFHPVPKPVVREKPPRPRKVRKPVRVGPPKARDAAYLAWIRDMDCWIGRGCFTIGNRRKVEVAHVKTRGAGGADRGNCLPLCPLHHDEQEGDTEGFEKVYGVSLKLAAAELLVEYIKAGEP